MSAATIAAASTASTTPAGTTTAPILTTATATLPAAAPTCNEALVSAGDGRERQRTLRASAAATASLRGLRGSCLPLGNVFLDDIDELVRELEELDIVAAHVALFHAPKTVALL